MLHCGEIFGNHTFRKESSLSEKNFFLLPDLSLSPTILQSKADLGIEDYRQKSCIPMA
jgi:hypothetical protein